MPQPSLASKVFIVIGSGSGIGLKTTMLLLESGARVGACDVNESSLNSFTSCLDPNVKSRVLTGVVDVSKRSLVSSFIQNVRAHFQRLDGIANVAGVGGRTFGVHNVWEIDDDEYDFVLQVNLRGLFNVLSESLKPTILDRPGSIVHVDSEYSFRGCRGGSIYSASKHAALGLVKSVALECGGKEGVRVNAVLPGPTDTPNRRAVMAALGTENDSTTKRPVGRPAHPKEIAEIILFLLSEKSSFVTGAAWTADGGSPI